jgi:hypothetical protein
MLDPENKFERSGKPLAIENLWEGNDFFYGSTQIQGDVRMALNTRCTEGNCFDRRKGIAVWGGGGDAGQVYCQMVLLKEGEAAVFLRLVDGAGVGVQLEEYNSVTDSWDTIGSNIGTADDRTDWDWTYANIAGEDRVYFTNGVSNLHYTNGTTVTEVSDVKAKYITTKENVLVIGGLTETYGENTVIWSHSNTHQFYADDGVDTFETSDYVIYLDSPCTGVKSFNWMVYAFTETDGLYEIDIMATGAIPRKISTHGTMSPKSIAVGDDSMFWADQYGIWSMPINGDIMKISKSVDSIYKQITGANFYQLTGGVNTNDQYELHLGDLTFEGTSYSDVILLYEIEQSRFYGRNIWRIDTGKFQANNIITWPNAYGFFTTFYGSRLTQTTYQTDYGYADVDQDIEVYWQSKDYVLCNDKREITIEDVYLRFEPLGSGDINIVVSMRMDTGDWVQIKDQELPNSSKSHDTIRIQAPSGLTGRAVAIKIESDGQLATKFRNILVTYSYNKSERRL